MCLPLGDDQMCLGCPKPETIPHSPPPRTHLWTHGMHKALMHLAPSPPPFWSPREGGVLPAWVPRAVTSALGPCNLALSRTGDCVCSLASNPRGPVSLPFTFLSDLWRVSAEAQRQLWWASPSRELGHKVPALAMCISESRQALPF